ncbi:hypothetical protein J6590_030680 [Homalodisca vitripennis]|nr:hypothetical protein J6590_030680 [Homalodisca vitripennis]
MSANDTYANFPVALNLELTVAPSLPAATPHRLVTSTAPAVYPDRSCYTPTTRMTQSCPWVSTTDPLFSQREMDVVVTISY